MGGVGGPGKCLHLEGYRGADSGAGGSEVLAKYKLAVYDPGSGAGGGKERGREGGNEVLGQFRLVLGLSWIVVHSTLCIRGGIRC